MVLPDPLPTLNEFFTKGNINTPHKGLQRQRKVRAHQNPAGEPQLIWLGEGLLTGVWVTPKATALLKKKASP